MLSLPLGFFLSLNMVRIRKLLWFLLRNVIFPINSRERRCQRRKQNTGHVVNERGFCGSGRPPGGGHIDAEASGVTQQERCSDERNDRSSGPEAERHPSCSRTDRGSEAGVGGGGHGRRTQSYIPQDEDLVGVVRVSNAENLLGPVCSQPFVCTQPLSHLNFPMSLGIAGPPFQLGKRGT